jgi:hypothetical protein
LWLTTKPVVVFAPLRVLRAFVVPAEKKGGDLSIAAHESLG